MNELFNRNFKKKKMETLNNDLVSKNYSGFKTYSPSELSTIYFDNILNNMETETSVNEFNKKYRYPFRDSLSFQLGRSMVKHCSPTNLIKWKISIREKQIVNDSDANKTTIETLSIVNEFLRNMSHKAMDRIAYYRDQEFDGKIYNNVRVLDYSVIITPEQFPTYRSILFNDKNQEVIMHYYFEFINWFPVTMSEFEKIFFLFLTFLTENQYPYGTDMH